MVNVGVGFRVCIVPPRGSIDRGRKIHISCLLLTARRRSQTPINYHTSVQKRTSSRSGGVACWLGGSGSAMYQVQDDPEDDLSGMDALAAAIRGDDT